MSTGLRRRHGTQAGAGQTVLPLTPLIDISLMLAVLLIAVMDAERDDRNLPVELPKTETGQPARPGFVVVIAADGSISVASERMDSAALGQAAAGREAAIIRADAAVAHGRVVAVVDVLRKAGVERILYAAEQGVVEW